MKKNEFKKMFDGKELSGQDKELLWQQIAVQIDKPKKSHLKQRLMKAAIILIAAAGLFCTINKISAGKLINALSVLWQTDQKSSQIINNMTDFHVTLDSVYAPEIIEYSEKRVIFAGTFGLVIYDRESRQVTGTIDLQAIECNYFNANTLETKFLLIGNDLTIYNQKNKKVYGNYYRYDLSQCGTSGKITALLPMESKKADVSLKTAWNKLNKGRYSHTFEQYKNCRTLFLERGALYSENSFIWEKDKNNIFDICLALIPDENYTGYSIVLYKKGHNNSAITQEPLFIQAVESPKKTTVLPQYREENASKLKQTVISCFYQNPSLYEGYCFGSSVKSHTVDTSGGDVAIPIIKIAAVDKKGSKVKILGSFYWFSFELSGKTLYESNMGGGPAVMYLKKVRGEYQVEKTVCPRDGSFYQKDLVTLFNGDEKAVSDFISSSKNLHKEIGKTLQKYVTANSLDITYYKPFGWEPEKINTASP